MEAQAEQPNALGKRVERGEQRLSGGGECRKIRHRRGEALRPGDDREVAELDLERDRAAGDFRALNAVPGITGDPLELGREPLGIVEILVERALGANRFVGPVWLDLALVDAA